MTDRFVTIPGAISLRNRLHELGWRRIAVSSRTVMATLNGRRCVIHATSPGSLVRLRHNLVVDDFAGVGSAHATIEDAIVAAFQEVGISLLSDLLRANKRPATATQGEHDGHS